MDERNETVNRKAAVKKAILGTFILLAWASILFWPVLSTSVVRATRPHNFIEARLEWTDRIGEDGFPTILYTRTVHRESFGVRDTWLDKRLHNGITVRTCNNSSSHGYTPGDSVPILYEVTALLTDRKCPVPSTPYRVCVKWYLEDGAAIDVTEPMCSDFYEPGVKTVQIIPTGVPHK